MTESSDDPAGMATPRPARKARWQRFSPSMGWPAFWSEILIVFLGVLIALAANEAVQEWNWRNKVNDAEARLKRDAHLLFAWYAELVTTQPCINAQLEALGQRVLASGEVLAPAPAHDFTAGISSVLRMPNRAYTFGAWEALGADGTATHFTRERQAVIDDIARFAQIARDRSSEIQQLLGRLQILRHPIPLDPGVRAVVMADISQLQLNSSSLTNIARQQMNRIISTFGRGDAARLDAFLQRDMQTRANDGVSGTVAFCVQQGHPLADWRAVIEATEPQR
jgi:hypothetical protein